MATHQTITPPPSPPPLHPTAPPPPHTMAPQPPSTGPPVTLPNQINIATRRQHILLNSLIIDRLRLALPPNASDPKLLGQGLAAFARIYYEFEDAWDELIHSVRTAQSEGASSHDRQVTRWLSNLRPTSLARTPRLKRDIKFLSSRTKTPLDKSMPSGEDAILRSMRRSIDENPVELVAYAWVMYMAIFSGGRWIRQQLVNAGEEFWRGPSSDMLEVEKFLESPGFSFLSFDGDQDGEDLKATFKTRFAEADALLTREEQEDVVAAAIDLFDDCIGLVGMLDRMVWWQVAWSQLRTGSMLVAMVLVLAYVFFIR